MRARDTFEMPGYSSELALLGANGPFLIIDSAEPVYNKYGWNSFAYLLNRLGQGQSGDVPFDYDTNEVENDSHHNVELYAHLRQVPAVLKA